MPLPKCPRNARKFDYEEYRVNLIKELEKRKNKLLNPDGTLKFTNCCDMTELELIDELLESLKNE